MLFFIEQSFIICYPKESQANSAMSSIHRSLYLSVREILVEARSSVQRSINFAMVKAYWSIGQLIVEDEQKGEKRASYGKALLKDLSTSLTAEFGRGFDPSNLRNMRGFYLAFPNCDALRHELSWTHYRFMLRVESYSARAWYMNEAANEGWSSRQLDRQISVLYYDRLLASKEHDSVKSEAQDKLQALPKEHFIKDPYVLEFLGISEPSSLRESALEESLINNLQEFLLELGKGFCFVARQKRMQFEDESFFVDLVFYNNILKCHVLIDLKIGKLTHQDIGQMDSYVRMFDAKHRIEGDNPTIGIVLCSEKNEAIVKYSILSDAKQIFASKYQLTLPTPEELQQELQRERALIEDVHKFEKDL